MGKTSEAAAQTDATVQGEAAGVVLTDEAYADAAASPAADAATGPAEAVADYVEHPLEIISEIEQLLRIVGNVAVHEFRRISERLADLKNHPSVKAPE
ncbi:hypothetical protein KTF22_08175 [Burkholderia multivorans]|uniref:hypothetical protein n=1 Tax=Burkholderia multivorans TaxID=87883 RepID=UPI001C217738|nr:hypothetical protein [Burkholderia multivorans]MBU9661866.1 hypothetical protein [Burkholderia multivorans]